MSIAVPLLPHRYFGFVLAACLGVAAATAMARSQPVQAGDPAPTRVTSDSQEFCAQLVEQLQQERQQAKAVPKEVVALSEEGRRMCQHGQVRPGIYRLRKAFQILQGER